MIYIASDHGGYELKTQIIEYIRTSKQFISDLGNDIYDSDDDYVDFAAILCRFVQNSSENVGILICRSGVGMCIAANKFKNIYAALVDNETAAKNSRLHNDANIIVLSADHITIEENLKYVKTFLENHFDENVERHKRRVDKIKEIEDLNFK